MSATVPRRTFWRYLLSAGGRSRKPQLVQAADGPEATLIASKTESGRHAPALDLDFNVKLKTLENGATRLIIPPRRIDFVAWSKAVFRMARLGWLKLDALEEGDVDPRFADGRGPDARVSGRSLVASLEEAVLCGAGAEAHLDFAVPVRLLPSSSRKHFHLYVDAEVAWDEYRGLIEDLCDAGLLGPDWVKLALRLEMTTLIRPGLTKKRIAREKRLLPPIKKRKRRAHVATTSSSSSYYDYDCS